MSQQLRSACRLCDARTMSALYQVAGTDVDRCDSCGFVQVRECPSDDILAEIYSRIYFSHGKYEGDWASHRERLRRLRCLDRLGVTPGATVLDAGCATGDFVAYGAERFEMWGVDISTEAIDSAQRRLPHLSSRLHAGRVEDLPLPRNHFDAIVLWDVVEHLWDPVASLTALAEMLRAGGALALSTPNIGAWTARRLGRDWPFMTPPEHLGFFSRRTMEILLERSGFRCERWQTAGKWTTLDFVLYKIRRIRPGLIPGFLRSGQVSRILHRLPLYVPSGDIQYVCARRR